MERYTTFLDWKSQYCENDYTTQSNLQIQCNPYQNYQWYFSQSWNKKIYNLYGNTKDPKQPKQSWERKMELEESGSLTSDCGYCLVSKSYPNICDPVDCNPQGFSVHGIFQARILQWVAMPSSRGSSQPRDQTHVSYVSCIGRRVLYQ